MKTDSEKQIPFLSDVDSFLAEKKKVENSAMSQTRLQALERYQQLGLPSRKDENYKYFSLTPIIEANFKLRNQSSELDPKLDNKKLNADITFINGKFIFDEAQLKKDFANIKINRKIEQAKVDEQIENETTNINSDDDNDAFLKLGQAFVEDQIQIEVSEVKSSRVLTIEFLEDQDNIFSAKSISIHQHKNSHLKLQLIESSNKPNNASFSLPIIEHRMNQNSSCEIFHQQTNQDISIFNYHATLKKDSSLQFIQVATKNKNNRINATINLTEPNCEVNYYALFSANQYETIDLHLSINHIASHCRSNQLIHALAQENATCTFRGRVNVFENAMLTNADQLFKGLLLHQTASINAIPQLEIYNDDVKCSHGATIGRLDEDATFYLQSRGLSKAAALNLLKEGFIKEIIDKAEDLEPELYRTTLETFLKEHHD